MSPEHDRNKQRAPLFARRTTGAIAHWVPKTMVLQRAATRFIDNTTRRRLCAVFLGVAYGMQCWKLFLLASTSATEDLIEPRPGKTCIALGIVARSKETELRQWHREIFRKHGNSHSFSDMVDIRLIFGMATPTQEIEKLKLESEMTNHNDIRVFEFEESEECGWRNRCLIRNDIQIYRDMQHMCDGDYDSVYFVKTDSDVVHNYEMMARVFMDLPNKSVYLGRLLPNLPIIKVVRDVAESSLDFDPVFAQGAFQGLSKDLLLKVLQRENIATVWKEETKYYHPESDRSLGLELRRANIPVNYPVFMKGCNYLCPAESFDCENHWNSISFHAGYGLSGVGKNNMAMKLGFMKSIHERQLQCLRPVTYDKDDHYIIFDDDILRNGNASYWFGKGCSTLSQNGLRDLHEFDTWRKELKENERPKNNWTCADKLYSKQKQKMKISHLVAIDDSSPFYENENEFSKALAKKMLQNGSDGVDFESRKHYITEGYRSRDLHYYCPHECLTDGHQPKCNCDMEATYLENYPDVALAVANDLVKSGHEHFVKYGSKEGRVWSCYPRYQTGTTKGCEGVFSDFVESAKHEMLDWPIGGSADFEITYPTCNAAVIVNDRDDPMVDFVLKNHRRYLGPYWTFYMLGPKETADLWREKYSVPMVEIVDIPENLGVNLSDYPHGYNTLLTSDFLWKEVVACENILITQTDALLLRHGIEDFFVYDYVGSPIYPESHPTTIWRLLHAFRDESGGNGGFSLRKRSAMLQALEECEITKKGSQEDVWTSACMVLLDRSMPDTRMANRFSVGSKCELDVPLGIHKLWQNCDASTCANVIVSSRFHRDLYGDEPFDNNCKEAEFLYLQRRPDVAAAVAEGRVASGWKHYETYGRFEEENNGSWRCLTRP